MDKPSAKKKKLFIPIVVGVIVLALVGGGIFFLSQGSNNNQQVPTQSTEQPVKVIQAQDIGLTLEPGNKANTIMITISKLEGIKSVEYEVTYDAEETAEGETAVVPKGVTNSPIEIESGDEEITREVYLGTCSRNVCRPDVIKSDIKFVFKVSFTDGSVGSLEETFSQDSL